MPKMKTNSGAKKRFKITGSGKVKRYKAYANHLLGRKSKTQKKRLAKSALVDATEEKNIKRLLAKG
ncbi:MAG: 50S ribosomal protein L35 [Bacteroidia bacterium]|nr:50S ribosomal protein L35 [Bacteroidia bacterium]